MKIMKCSGCFLMWCLVATIRSDVMASSFFKDKLLDLTKKINVATKELYNDNPMQNGTPLRRNVLANITDLMGFPGEVTKVSRDALQKLTRVSSTEEFLSLFGLQVDKGERGEVTSRVEGGERGEVSSKAKPSYAAKDSSGWGGPTHIQPVAVEEAPVAYCAPEKQVVKLDLEDDPGVLYFPSCVRLERCGGCCYSDMLACQPTATQAVRLKVIKVSNGKVEQVIVNQYRHTRCSCNCRVLEEHCNKRVHNYDATSCKCVCKDSEGKSKCPHLTHSWMDDKCECVCHKNEECSSGLLFNETTCKCEAPSLSYSSHYGRMNAVSGSNTKRRRERPVRIDFHDQHGFAY